MADTTLSPTGLVQIEVGASDSTWGTKENADKATINGWFSTGPVLKVANGGTGAATARAAYAAISVGTNTNDSATAGNVGEEVRSVLLVGSGVGLTTGVAANITTISLTAGDWDVEGIVCQSADVGASVGTIAGWVSASSATWPGVGEGSAQLQLAFVAGANNAIATGSKRFSLTATTTIYLSSYSYHSGGTNLAYGTIRARRVR